VQPQLAAAQQQPEAGEVLARGQSGLMIRDARLDELLAAHRQLGGASALQMPAGFVRNATFDGPAR
jgi:sigma-E factor negative regulatory protein RseA